MGRELIADVEALAALCQTLRADRARSECRMRGPMLRAETSNDCDSTTHPDADSRSRFRVENRAGIAKNVHRTLYNSRLLDLMQRVEMRYDRGPAELIDVAVSGQDGICDCAVKLVHLIGEVTQAERCCDRFEVLDARHHANEVDLEELLAIAGKRAFLHRINKRVAACPLGHPASEDSLSLLSPLSEKHPVSLAKLNDRPNVRGSAILWSGRFVDRRIGSVKNKPT